MFDKFDLALRGVNLSQSDDSMVYRYTFVEDWVGLTFVRTVFICFNFS